MTSMEITEFSRPPTPCLSTFKFLPPLWHWTSNFKRTSPLHMISNHDHQFMLSDPSFRSAFVFSINSLILSGFSLTSFNCAEAPLFAFSWLYTLVCVVVKKFHDMSFVYNYTLFYKNKSLDLGKNFRNKLKTKPGVLSHRT